MVDRKEDVSPNCLEVDIDFDAEFSGIDIKNDMNLDFLDDDPVEDENKPSAEEELGGEASIEEPHTHESNDFNVDFEPEPSEPEFNLEDGGFLDSLDNSDTDLDTGGENFNFEDDSNVSVSFEKTDNDFDFDEDPISDNREEESEGLGFGDNSDLNADVSNDIDFDDEEFDLDESSEPEAFDFDDDAFGDDDNSVAGDEDQGHVDNEVDANSFDDEVDVVSFDDGENSLLEELNHQLDDPSDVRENTESKRGLKGDSASESSKSGLMKEFSIGAKNNSEQRINKPEKDMAFEEDDVSTAKPKKAGSAVVLPVLISSIVAGSIGAGTVYFLSDNSGGSELTNVLMRLSDVEERSHSNIADIEKKISSVEGSLLTKIQDMTSQSVSIDEFNKLKTSVDSNYKGVLSGQEDMSKKLSELTSKAEDLKKLAAKKSGEDGEHRKLVTALVSLKSMVDNNQEVSEKQYSDLLDLVRLQEVNSSHEIEKVKENLQNEITGVLKVVKDNQERYKKLQSSQNRRKAGETSNSQTNMVEDALGLNNEINIVKGGKPAYVLKGIMPNRVFLNMPIDGGKSVKLVSFRVGDPLDGYGKITGIDHKNETVLTASGEVKLIKTK